MIATVYSKDDCVWCERAKNLLKEKEIPYVDLKYNIDYTKMELMERVETYKSTPAYPLTVPQIFFEDKYIGTYEDLVNYLRKNDV
jgi:glutaredoxin